MSRNSQVCEHIFFLHKASFGDIYVLVFMYCPHTYVCVENFLIHLNIFIQNLETNERAMIKCANATQS